MDKVYKKQLKYFNHQFSQVSDYTLSAWQKSYVSRIKKYVIRNGTGKLLDIGSGKGYAAIELAKEGIKVTACDLSPQSIKNLKNYKKHLKLKNLILLCCNAEKLPFKDKSFDFIIANALLEHLPQEEQAISEWKRILKDSGRMFIGVPLSLKYVWPFLWPITIAFDKHIGHLRRYDKESLQAKFKLRLIKVIYTGHLFKVFGVLLSKLLRTTSFLPLLEKQDAKKEHLAYGANNIIAIFEKHTSKRIA